MRESHVPAGSMPGYRVDPRKEWSVDEPVRRTFPLFRYHPFPVYTGSIKALAITCPVCGLPSEYSYEFVPDRPEDETLGDGGGAEQMVRVCPWCLHDGTAARRYPGTSFNDAPRAAGIPAPAREELEYRTPTYYTFQEKEWPTHHDDYCAFIGYAGWKEIAAYAAELAADLARLRRWTKWVKADLEAWKTGSSVQGYLFRCLTCGVHRLTVDMD